MPAFNRIIVVGTSTGGIEALQQLVRMLPADFAAPLLVVNHTGPGSPNVLASILQRAGPLPASTAVDGARIVAGQIYVAPADFHLLVAPGDVLRTARGPKENRVRPAIDPLFRSAAAVYGPRAVGVVLTGHLDDGTAGLWAIRAGGGVAIVQNPEEAPAPSMPLNALKHVEVNHCLYLEKIGPLLAKLAATAPENRGAAAVPPDVETDVRIAAGSNPLDTGLPQWGSPSMFACPECHGVLMQKHEGGVTRYRCHTGHAYSAGTLLDDFGEKSEEALWNAIRAMEESVMLLGQLAEQLDRQGRGEAAHALREKAARADERSKAVRRLLFGDEARGGQATAA